jgi:hypothetical protein
MTQLTTIRPIVNTINRFTRALENPQDTAGLKKAFKRVQSLEGKYTKALQTVALQDWYSVLTKKNALIIARDAIRGKAEAMSDPKFAAEHGKEYVLKQARFIRELFNKI